MDEYEVFRVLAASTAQNLLKTLPPKEWTADGRTIKGWTVVPGDSYNTEKFERNYWHEYWGCNGEVILDIDGEFYRYSWGKESSSNFEGTRSSEGLHRLDASALVGSEGAPFSEYTDRLRRMNWA
jgi:hypothetical protein